MGFELRGGPGQRSYFDFLRLAGSSPISNLPLRPQLIQIGEVDRLADTRFLQGGVYSPRRRHKLAGQLPNNVNCLPAFGIGL
jgi:hypothetical protein